MYAAWTLCMPLHGEELGGIGQVEEDSKLGIADDGLPRDPEFLGSRR